MGLPSEGIGKITLRYACDFTGENSVRKFLGIYYSFKYGDCFLRTLFTVRTSTFSQNFSYSKSS
jgi:hypothetical protein